MIKSQVARLRTRLGGKASAPDHSMLLPLFDRAWYLRRNPDVAAAGVDPLVHFAEFGGVEGRSPHPLFDSAWYLDRNPDIGAAGVNPLRHFLEFGGLEERDPSPLFSSSWYLARNPDIAERQLNPIIHYVQEGAARGLAPHPLFDPEWYRSQAAGALPAGIDPLRHYIETGAAAGLSPHPLMDAKAYLEQNPEVSALGIDPLSHFIRFGLRERHNPHRLFDTAWYVQQNPGLLERGENPLMHYVMQGAFEGSDPNPAFDNDWYLEHYPEVRAARIAPLVHYVAVGAAEGRKPGPEFDPAWYAETYAEEGQKLDDPFAHYLHEGREREFQTRPIQAKNAIAVVFLARSGDGSTAGFEKFVRSYRKFSAGVDHDLIVIRKGEAQKPGSRFALDLMFEGTNAGFIDVSDQGYDLQAYLKVAAIIPHEFVCFLNSHSEIMADDWLRKLSAPLADPGVGAAGATASYESITDTIDLCSKVIWLAGRGDLPVHPDMVSLFRSELKLHAPDWLESAEAQLEAGEADSTGRGLDIDRDVEYAQFWSAMGKPGGPLQIFNGFRRFPNPHIRTTGFVMRRALLLSFRFALDDTKIACNRFESGPGSLPERLAGRKLRSVLVGADGRTFEVGQWSQSETFRLGDQSNVLIRDNRVNEFFDYAPGDRRRMAQVSWGAYAGPVSEAFRRLGFDFARADLDVSPRDPIIRSPGSDLTISIVIPTHNRSALVRDALSTIVAQSYPHWTCAVFDNASTEPLRAIVEAFGDDRITYVRSDRFLPVTESWNGAIDLARGDYVLLTGDDDGLAPRGLETVAEIVRRFDNPEVIYSALYQFFHPGVAPWEPSGYVARLRSGFFFAHRNEPFLLDSKAARLAVTGSLRFRRNFTFNMQAFFFRSDFLQRMRRGGKVFQSPFPDYYLANLAMGLAQDVVVLPDPVSIAGVSRKSFGFTLFNDQPEKGDQLLATDLADDRLYGKLGRYMLPGPSYDTKFALTMEHVADALGSLSPTQVDVGRYRRLQIFKSLGGVPGLTGAKDAGDAFAELVRPRLSKAERGWAEDLRRLGAQAAEGEAEARATLDRLDNSVSMYAPAGLALQHEKGSVGDFDGLPRLFAALRAGRVRWT